MTIQQVADIAGLDNSDEAIDNMDKTITVPKLTDMTIEDLKILIAEVVATTLKEHLDQLISTVNNSHKFESDNSSANQGNRLYVNSEGKYVLLPRTPEEIALQSQAISDMFDRWDREYDVEEQRETFACLQKALPDDFPPESLVSENLSPVSQ